MKNQIQKSLRDFKGQAMPKTKQSQVKGGTGNSADQTQTIIVLEVGDN